MIRQRWFVFLKGGQLGQVYEWYYINAKLGVVITVIYWGTAFSKSGFFSLPQKTLANEAQKSIFSMNHMPKKVFAVNPLITRKLFHKLILYYVMVVKSERLSERVVIHTGFSCSTLVKAPE